MKTLFITILLLGCSGPAFTGINDEQGNNQAAAGGGSKSFNDSGTGGLRENARAGSSGFGGMGFDSSTSGGMANSPPQAGSSGTPAMAGRPAMGEGGEAGSSGGASDSGPSSCLTNHQTLACASICDSNPYCQGILDCFVRTNSDLTTDCPGFNDTGYSLALEAERNCCK